MPTHSDWTPDCPAPFATTYELFLIHIDLHEDVEMFEKCVLGWQYETRDCSKSSSLPFAKFILQIVCEIHSFVPKLFVPLVHDGTKIEKLGQKNKNKKSKYFDFFETMSTYPDQERDSGVGETKGIMVDRVWAWQGQVGYDLVGHVTDWRMVGLEGFWRNVKCEGGVDTVLLRQFPDSLSSLRRKKWLTGVPLCSDIWGTFWWFSTLKGMDTSPQSTVNSP